MPRNITPSMSGKPVEPHIMFGRVLSFTNHRVSGFWRGGTCGVQILPPPPEAPSAPVELAEHPFILEFAFETSGDERADKIRRLQEHHRLTRLLNLLLVGRTNTEPRQLGHLWALVSGSSSEPDIRWVQQFYFARIGPAVSDAMTLPTSPPLELVDPPIYYQQVGHRGGSLKVPADLEESILQFQRCSAAKRERLNRALFWLDLASRHWNLSVSASFAALVSAVESLTERGEVHEFDCPECRRRTQHEVPGATRRFKEFFEEHLPGEASSSARNKMYELRSDISHGTKLMHLDEAMDVGDPMWEQRDLHDQLWRVTRIALRAWLRSA